MYILVIVHTFDRLQRTGEIKRNKTFMWFSASLLYYTCDRACMFINNRYRVLMVSSSVVNGGKGSRMIILKLKRPSLFRFQPGQYAYLKMSSIDSSWHPFSIASGPQSEYLEFNIEVYSDESWTGKLWDMLRDNICIDGIYRNRIIWMEVIGPCGAPLAKMEDYSHAIVIGSGTGVCVLHIVFARVVLCIVF